jgi:hypothetical protein
VFDGRACPDLEGCVTPGGSGPRLAKVWWKSARLGRELRTCRPVSVDATAALDVPKGGKTFDEAFPAAIQPSASR